MILFDSLIRDHPILYYVVRFLRGDAMCARTAQHDIVLCGHVRVNAGVHADVLTPRVVRPLYMCLCLCIMHMHNNIHEHEHDMQNAHATCTPHARHMHTTCTYIHCMCCRVCMYLVRACMCMRCQLYGIGYVRHVRSNDRCKGSPLALRFHGVR